MLPHRTWNFNIDRYLNPLVPSPPWRHLPYPVARFFGYRSTKPQETGNLMPVFWAFIGVFSAILLIEAVSKRVPSFESVGAPIIVGSFGAAAVLEFYSIEAPLAQPRNAIFGQIISALVGTAVAKLFQLSDRFEDIQWVGGALACASATALMALTKTVHPPAGATALLAVVDKNLVHIGWFLIPVMFLGCALMLGVALIVNNIERRFPIYWWTPEDLSKRKPILKRRDSSELTNGKVDEEKAIGGSGSATAADSAADTEGNDTGVDDTDNVDETPKTRHSTKDETDGKTDGDGKTKFTHARQHIGEIVIRRGEVVVPEHVFLTQEEEQLLETMSYRL